MLPHTREPDPSGGIPDLPGLRERLVPAVAHGPEYPDPGIDHNDYVLQFQTGHSMQRDGRGQNSSPELSIGFMGQFYCRGNINGYQGIFSVNSENAG